MTNVQHLQDDSCKINSRFTTRKHSNHTENPFFPFFSFFFLKTWLPCKKPQTKLPFFVLVWMCVCGCVPDYPLKMCAFPSCPSVFQPRDALTFDCGDDGECTGYLLIRLSCSVTGRINQSGGWLCTYIFQAHLRTSGEEITVLASQI